MIYIIKEAVISKPIPPNSTRTVYTRNAQTESKKETKKKKRKRKGKR